MHDFQYRVIFKDKTEKEWTDYDPHEGIDIANMSLSARSIQVRLKPADPFKELKFLMPELKTAYDSLKTALFKWGL